MSAIPNPAEFQHLNAHVPKVALPPPSKGKKRVDGCNTAAFYRASPGGKYQPIGSAYGMGENCNRNNFLGPEQFRYMYKIPK